MRRHGLAAASGLVAAGVKPRDHVVLMSENRLEWLYCDLAIPTAGAIRVPTHPNVSAEIAHAIGRDCQASLAIVSDQTKLAKLEGTGDLKKIVLMDVEGAGWVAEPSQQMGEISARLAALQPDDVCTVVYTSGTTGDPKGVELAHRNLVDISRAIL